ncbi:MAG TPA: hypothetical protein VG649_09920 [Candidatus Angelobacter sp.]|jgi:hypothetical protein|nr:hypothetical protein [Candidatus Angelobacter sp.]
MSQRTRYGLVVLIAVVLSVAGVLIGAFVTDPADGGRGGAVAVALAFIVLFVRRDYGSRVYDALTKDIPALRQQIRNLREGKADVPKDGENLAEIKKQVTAIVSRLDTESDGQKDQNRALAWASCIGTIAWGFGDLAAKLLKLVCHI